MYLPLNTLMPRQTRLMVLAPHPDDETLGCGTLLQRAVRAGAAIKVLYATDGDNNPWPQRVVDRKWRLGERDRQRWGRFRRGEARAALRVLGVPAEAASFLGFPDQGLTRLVKSGGVLASSVRRAIIDWEPNLLIPPSISDAHPDHSALGALAQLIYDSLIEQGADLTGRSYVVHGNRAALGPVAVLEQSRSECQIKQAAIACHKTQLLLSSRRFLAYATRPETFHDFAVLQRSRVTELVRSRVSDQSTLGLALARKAFTT